MKKFALIGIFAMLPFLAFADDAATSELSSDAVGVEIVQTDSTPDAAAPTETVASTGIAVEPSTPAASDDGVVVETDMMEIPADQQTAETPSAAASTETSTAAPSDQTPFDVPAE